jgi:hypothetical protein
MTTKTKMKMKMKMKMKTRMNSYPLLACAFTACMATSASAATFFSDSLTSDTGNFAAGTGTGAVTYGAGGATFADTGNNGRRYLGTTGNYWNVDFTASMRFATPAVNMATFFGIGSGDAGSF